MEPNEREDKEYDVVDTYEGSETYVYYDEDGVQHVKTKEA